MSMIESQGWGPPGTWSHPQGCDCGCGGGGWGSIQDCWRQTAELKAIIRQVVTGMNLQNGVTDGSDAKPGQIGECMDNQVNGTFTAAPQTQIVTTLVLSPGDWDVSAECLLTATSDAMTGAQFELSPIPTGASRDINGAQWSPSSQTDPDLWTIHITSIPAQINCTVPTLLAWKLATNNTSAGAPATGPGTFSFNVHARRSR